MNQNGSANLATLTLRATFFILLLVMAVLHVTSLFRGLDSAHGMEQAAIAREVARGNGLVTKVLRPASIRQNREATNETGTLADACKNTYHAPLQPLLLGAVFRAQGAQNFEAWRPGKNEYIYQLDRVVAGFSIVCMMLAIGVTYLLVCRIFDARIASTTALLMLFCELFWKMSMSGLPQMLMLLLFTCGCYFAYRAIEASEEGGLPILHALLAAVFFALLCLTHWLAIWIVIGYAVMAALFIKPRGVAGIIALVAVIAAVIVPVLQNIKVSGNPGGTAVLVLFEGLAGSEEYAMRSLETIPLNLRQLAIHVLRLSVMQTKDLYAYFGAIIAAPIFFVALFHPFKRASISHFRWVLLVMWISATLGMALFGLKGGENSPNQLHLLFAPLMGAYGLAMLSVLWSRLEFPKTIPLMSHAHLALVVVISASPFMLRMPFDVLNSLSSGENIAPNYPPYAPSILDSSIVDYADKNEIIASDQPWAVAWYADRRSLWLPIKLSELETIENIADAEETPIVGVLTTPISSGTRPLTETAGFYGEYLSLMLDGWAALATSTSPERRLVSKEDRELKGFYSRYPFPRVLFFRSSPMVLYTSRSPGS
ncbi:glycosyltransferase family 39 protein [Roseibacillus persicicus]|uniref:Glycosyltransferase RgtA/B/C/D-like domain-containing protein n=1 Tax=Roseibacillus persicicus TaxID=454148 RepID=A0A918WP78_9BACT|nr:glycosyltransferase family 39 protein [Roseibacillus persicicus]MDQ8188714.1 glycosyltransferase family 39 protein [Roseibacillus persicicus]GHC63245.1 hypothetical protein GCM10007100_33470 [Roseibacillus persicicus]